jgi:hypothetical protein
MPGPRRPDGGPARVADRRSDHTALRVGGRAPSGPGVTVGGNGLRRDGTTAGAGPAQGRAAGTLRSQALAGGPQGRGREPAMFVVVLLRVVTTE